MNRYYVTGIEWVLDGENVNLPTEMMVQVPEDENDPGEYISNKLSEETGFLHAGFVMEKNFEVGCMPKF